MKTRHWIIIITKDPHLIVPYIVTQDDCSAPLIFHSERNALSFLSDNYGTEYGKIFEFETESESEG